MPPQARPVWYVFITHSRSSMAPTSWKWREGMTIVGAAGFPDCLLGPRPCTYTPLTPHSDSINALIMQLGINHLPRVTKPVRGWAEIHQWAEFICQLRSLHPLSLSIHSVPGRQFPAPLFSVLIKVTDNLWTANQMESCLTLFQYPGHLCQSPPPSFSPTHLSEDAFGLSGRTIFCPILA